MIKKGQTSTTIGGKRRYWLFKSESSCFSIDDLAAAPERTTYWDGVRNYQARNMLRDEIQVGDQVLYYHSNSVPLAIVGTATVVRAGYPDHTAFDPNEDHYDPESNPDSPRWFMVDIRLLEKFAKPITRDMLKSTPATANMMIMQKGSRLSVTPVTSSEWDAVLRLAEEDLLDQEDDHEDAEE